MAQSAVPIRESVGAALRFVRENLRFIAIVSACGALATGATSAFALTAPQLPLIALAANALVQAFVYAAFLGAALFGANAVGPRWASDGGRVWGAMAIIGALLFIVLFVASMPVAIVLAAGPLAPYVARLESAGNDSASVMAIMTEFAEANSSAMLAVTAFYGVIWILLTSRLYLAAPASVDRARVVSVEAWKWTKGAVVRVVAARALLLVPAYIFTLSIAYLIGLPLGYNTLRPAAPDPASYPALILFAVLSSFVTFALYAALEAGLSTYLYKGLRPEDAPSTARGSTGEANLG